MFLSYKDSVIGNDSNSNSRIDMSFEVAWDSIHDTAREYLDGVEELGKIHKCMNSFSIDKISNNLVAHGAKNMEYRNLVTY